MRDYRRPSSDQGAIEPRRPTPGETARLAPRERSGGSGTVAGVSARRHEPRWRDIQWVDFTIDSNSVSEAEPAAPPLPAAPPARETPEIGDVLRLFAQPARGRPRDQISGLAARFAKLPVRRPATSQPAALPAATPRAADQPAVRPAASEMVVRPRMPDPNASPAPIPAPPALTKTASTQLPEAQPQVRDEPAHAKERFPAAILAPVATQPEPRIPAPSIAATLAARLSPVRAIVRRRAEAIAGAVNAGLARARATLRARQSPAEPTPMPPTEAVAPSLEPALRAAGPSRLAALAARIEAAARRLAGNERRRLRIWRTVGGGAIAVAIIAYLIGYMLAGLAGTTPEKPPRVASDQPVQSVRASAPVPPPASQLQPGAQPPQTPAMSPSDPAGRAAFYLARAKAGDPAAQYDIGVLYAKGSGLVQDFASAAAWFQAAAAQGNINAQYNLGVLYERGLGVPASAIDAINWYRSAADQNHAGAQYNLAIAYAEGRGTEQDLAAAARWYQRAAQQGLAPAMVNLAILYERGRGVDRSLLDAYAWYNAAGERGDAAAKERAVTLLRQFSDQDKAHAEGLAATISATVNGVPPPA
jgi:hypothetical protein